MRGQQQKGVRKKKSMRDRHIAGADSFARDGDPRDTERESKEPKMERLRNCV